MQQPPPATGGITVAPHGLAAETGLAVLREGGNAAEATIAMAASLSVLYPHMTGLGGDSFWLLAGPGEPVTAVDACGRSALGLDPDAYRAAFEAMPHRGPWVANTVAGTVSGWQAAWDHSRRRWSGRLPAARLLAEAIGYARDGCSVTDSQSRSAAGRVSELSAQPGFATAFGEARAGGVQRLPALACTLAHLAQTGFEDFYRGELAACMAAELEAVGSPLRRADFERHRASVGEPLALQLRGHLGRGTVYTTAPPSQGLATLLILGQFDQAPFDVPAESAEWVHLLVEATKSAFQIRDALIRDPIDMAPLELASLLAAEALQRRAGQIDPEHAGPWGTGGGHGDTTWFGAIDGQGRAVSCIQSIYHEFGSGVVLRDSGICWQNRGASFSLDPAHFRTLKPGRKPFHTLCPSLARLHDGRTLVFGTMGGDGQPQTQAAFLSRYLRFGNSLQEAIDRPRWVLGRTWGAGSDALKVESRFAPQLIAALRRRGHAVEQVGDFDEMMGHAGALVRDDRGRLEGAADPRSDGAVAVF